MTDYTKVIQTKILDMGLYTDLGSREQKIADSLFDVDDMTTSQDEDVPQENIDTSLFNTNYKAPEFV